MTEPVEIDEKTAKQDLSDAHTELPTTGQIGIGCQILRKDFMTNLGKLNQVGES